MRLLLALIPAFALTAQSPPPPDARRLLIRSGGSVLVADQVRLEGKETTEIVAPAMRQSIERTFSMVRSSGGRMRSEGKIGDSTFLQISDGSSLWVYFAATRTYTKMPAPAGPAADGFSRLKFSRDPAGFSDARVEREEPLEFAGKSVACDVVRAAYASMPGNPAARDVVRTVWIARSNDLILRDTWEFSANSAASAPLGRSHITTNYTLIEWGIPLSDDLFIFHPPEGSRAVTGEPGSPAVSSPNALSNGTPTAGKAVLLRKVQPEYTADARAAGYQGTVSLYLEVDQDGKPANVEVMQGLGLGLDEKAVEAVKQWEFKPKSMQGSGVQDALEAQVHFHLDPPAPWHVAGEVYTILDADKQRLGEIARPVPTRYVPPDPAACRIAGATVIALTVDQVGAPRDVRAIRGDSSIAIAAVKAVQSWQFQPGFGSGEAVDSEAQVEFECRPPDAAPEPVSPALPAYRVGGGVSPPLLESKIEPEYSEAARKVKLQGSALLTIQVSPAGVATNIHVLRMLGSGLDKKAMEAIKRWRFKPGMKDGQPVTVEATIEVNFRLL